MEKIDFSKAPEGATHYRSGVSDTTLWYKKDPSINPVRYYWVWWCSAIGEWSSCGDCAIEATKMHKQQTVTCDNERELMLCEEVLRMCRREASEFKDHTVDEWYTKNGTGLNINTEYRAKPKKELIVPWEWLDEDICGIKVNDRGQVLAIDSSNQGWEIKLKLDLADIELPVTVHRPQ